MNKIALYNLLNDQRFEQLQAHLNGFNPLKILRVHEFEIRHSNVLAWLFDPAENHQLDDLFFKKFLLTVLTMPENYEKFADTLEALTIHSGRFYDLQVYREQNDIDLLMVSDSAKLVLLIENKVNAKESAGQLQKYLSFAQQQYGDYTIVPVYLTLEGDEPSLEVYLQASYQMVLETLESITQLRRDALPPRVLQFILDYVHVLEDKYGMDQELKNLCMKIYRDNKDAIDLIYNLGNQFSFDALASQFAEQKPEITIRNIKDRWIDFLEPYMHDAKPQVASWCSGKGVTFWFYKEELQLKLVLEIGPFLDSAERLALVEQMEQRGHRFTARAKRDSAKYSRIESARIKINDWSDADEVVAKMVQLYDKPSMRKASADLELAMRQIGLIP